MSSTSYELSSHDCKINEKQTAPKQMFKALRDFQISKSDVIPHQTLINCCILWSLPDKYVKVGAGTPVIVKLRNLSPSF